MLQSRVNFVKTKVDALTLVARGEDVGTEGTARRKAALTVQFYYNPHAALVNPQHAIITALWSHV